MEIVFKEVHVGPCASIVTLRLGSDAPADDFLAALITSNRHAAKSLQTSMATITAVEGYQNERKFKRVAPGIYEIKVPGRLYCFKDQRGDDPPITLIIATNGGNKNTKKEQGADIRRARKIRDRYLALKELPATTARYIPLTP